MHLYRTLRTKIVEASLVGEGLIYARAFQGSEITLTEAKEFAELIHYLSEEGPYSAVIDITGVTYVAKEAREYLSQSSSMRGKAVSVALVTTSYSSRIIGHLVLTLSRPSYPIRLFSDTDLALQWCRKTYRTHMACAEELF